MGGQFVYTATFFSSDVVRSSALIDGVCVEKKSGVFSNCPIYIINVPGIWTEQVTIINNIIYNYVTISQK